MTTRLFEIYIDGASKGNPGPAGIGVIVCRGDEVVANVSEYIGRATNNVAEYTAFISGLREAQQLKARSITVKTDSELLCRQINRQYKVKNPGIISLYNQAVRLISEFEHVVVQHVPREMNKGADKLATLAIKKHFPSESAH